MKEIEEWFKIKRYPHIGNPITIKDYDRVKRYVENPDNIRKHSFMPFIHKSIVKRKFRALKPTKKSKAGNRMRFSDKPKVRPTFFASHLDSLILSKYNRDIYEKYEKYIKDLPFNKSVVAYRKIPIIDGQKGNCCNIDFAKSAFQFIKESKVEELTTVIADISSFFDMLDHKILKKKWSQVLGKKSLPDDHFNIYKALTRIKYVESNQLYKSYGKQMLVRRGVSGSSTHKETVRKYISSSKYFKEKNAVSYCTKKEFLDNNLNLVISKDNITGIPQGSPISATLANVYMLDFDDIMSREIFALGGFYQRYCDDLIIVVNRENEQYILDLLYNTVEGQNVKLPISNEKTNLFHFRTVNNVCKCFSVDVTTRKEKQESFLEYLGFTFDGDRVLIKSAGFSKYYRTMKSAFNRATSLAINGKNPDKSIFKSRLYSRFTYKGKYRKLIWRQSNQDPNKYYKTKKYDWGNYLSYIDKANDTMKIINGDDSIKRQSRRFWAYFHKLFRKAEKLIKETT